MFQNISKVNYLVNHKNKTIENFTLFMKNNHFIKNTLTETMYILNMKEKERKASSFELTLLELISYYDEDDKSKIDYSFLNHKLDYLESLISTLISSCFISSVYTTLFLNTFVKYLYYNSFMYNTDEKFFNGKSFNK